MEKGNEKVMSLVQLPQKAMKDVQFKLKELENGYKSWLAKQSLPVEAAVVTATTAINGAAIGAFLGVMTQDLTSSLPTPPPQASLNPDAVAPFQQVQAVAGGPLVQARNFAVITGVNAGISCVMKRLRGKEDLQSSIFKWLLFGNAHASALSILQSFIKLKYAKLTSLYSSKSLVAAFGSGAAFSLVSGMGGANPAANAFTSGLLFAIFQGCSYKIGEMWQSTQRPSPDDLYYARTRGMLDKLGLQNYTKNFKRGLLTDSTLPLLTDSALRDVRIPPGPRLLILDHIQRDPDLKKSR